MILQFAYLWLCMRYWDMLWVYCCCFWHVIGFFVCFFGNCCVWLVMCFFCAKIINNKITAHNRTNPYWIELYRGCQTSMICIGVVIKFFRIKKKLQFIPQSWQHFSIRTSKFQFLQSTSSKFQIFSIWPIVSKTSHIVPNFFYL